MSIGLRKLVKVDPVGKALFTTPPSLTGGAFMYGKIGGGKTTTMLSLVQRYHDNPERRYKIIDLYGGDRKEQLYWCLPSMEYNYWSKVKKLLKLDKEGPKQYHVHILYAYYHGAMPKHLPNYPPYVRSSVFTLPASAVAIDDIQLAIGNTSESDIFLWRECLDNLKRKEGPARLLNIAKEVGKENQILLRNFISPLTKNLTLQSEYCAQNLDVIAELKDRDTITVFSFEFVPKEFQLFVMGWIMRQVAEALDKGKASTRNIMMIREAAEFFRATDDSIVPERYKIFRKQLAHFIRMGRRGMHLFLDAQSPHETKGMVDGCLSENTSIRIYENETIVNKEIKNLPEFFEVESYNSSLDIIERKSAKKIDTGEKECYKITLEDGKEVIATEDHRFFDHYGEEIHVKDLTISNRISVIKRKEHTEDAKKRIKETIRRKLLNGEMHNEKGRIPWNKGIKLTEKHKKRVSDRTRIAMKNPDVMERLISSHTGLKCSEESKIKHGIAAKRWHAEKKGTPEYMQMGLNISAGVKRHFSNNPKFREDLRIKMRKQMQNPEFRKKALQTPRNVKPNKSERKVIEMVRELNLPCKFTGNGIFWITEKENNFNPDFVDLENLRIIEVYGDYWHRNTEEKDKKRISAYENRGFKVLVLDSKETMYHSILKNKLMEFYNVKA